MNKHWQTDGSARPGAGDHLNVAEPLVSFLSPASLEADQYRTVRHTVERLRRDAGYQVFAVTSPAPGDGKTITLQLNPAPGNAPHAVATFKGQLANGRLKIAGNREIENKQRTLIPLGDDRTEICRGHDRLCRAGGADERHAGARRFRDLRGDGT